MRVYSRLYLVLVLALVGCSGAVPTPESLDWHLDFSSDTQTALARCRDINPSDDSVQDILPPLVVEMWATVLTEQAMQEAIQLLETGNPALAQRVRERYSGKSYFYILITPNIVSERNLLEPYELSPMRFPGELYSLAQINFYVPQVEEIVVKAGETELALAAGFTFPDSMRIGQTYAIPIDRSNLTAQTMAVEGAVELNIELVPLPPFPNVLCGESGRAIFSLNLPVSNGTSDAMPNAYGESLPTDVSIRIRELRLALLTHILPSAFASDYRPTPTPTPTLEPSSTPIATARP